MTFFRDSLLIALASAFFLHAALWYAFQPSEEDVPEFQDFLIGTVFVYLTALTATEIWCSSDLQKIQLFSHLAVLASLVFTGKETHPLLSRITLGTCYLVIWALSPPLGV